jgi:hypothetical protein
MYRCKLDSISTKIVSAAAEVNECAVIGSGHDDDDNDVVHVHYSLPLYLCLLSLSLYVYLRETLICVCRRCSTSELVDHPFLSHITAVLVLTNYSSMALLAQQHHKQLSTEIFSIYCLMPCIFVLFLLVKRMSMI